MVKEYTDDERKHLDFVQSIISRLAQCSFQLKQWSVLLVTICFCLGLIIFDRKFILIALISILCFWFLDAFYLHQERKYRGLFNALTNSETPHINAYDLNASNYLKGFKEYLIVLFSRTISLVYIPLILVVLFRGVS